ncbi:MAG: gamma subclass chorismate mutase AroQ [Prosthecobacter sp.]
MRHLLSFLLCLFSASCAGTGPGGDLPHLLVERLGWMDEVAQVKQAKALPVTDAKREAELLQAMETKGAAKGLPATAVRSLFSGQMDAAKQVQREWLQAHKNVPAAGGALPDLAATVRPALDKLGDEMLSALAKARALKVGPQTVDTAREQMTAAGYSSAVIRPALKGLEAAFIEESGHREAR